MLFPGDVSPQGRHAGAYDPSTNRKRKLPRILLILLSVAAIGAGGWFGYSYYRKKKS